MNPNTATIELFDMSTIEQNHSHPESLCVIIPAYNEAQRIGPTLESTIAYCQENVSDFTIIVVDDGSTDTTASVVLSYEHSNVQLLQVKNNTGKGNAVKMGIMMADKPFVLFMDADGATHIREVEKLFLAMLQQKADIVIGTRKTKEAHILHKQSFSRRFMGGFFTFLSRLITQTNYSDYMCGFKLFTIDAAKTLARLQTTNRFTFDTEYLCIAHQRNLKVAEVPITWENKDGSKVRKVRDTVSSLYDLAKIALYRVQGTYRR